MRKLTIAILTLYGFLSGYVFIARAFGIPYQPFFTPFLSLLAFLFAILHAGQYLGWRSGLLLLVFTFLISLLFESIGVATGWFYGPYHYTDKLGVKFLDLVPLIIPVAWFMMSYPSFVIALRVVPGIANRWTWSLMVASVGALAMTAWDLAMDPVMVAGNHWVWDVEGNYFGIPLQNYVGWWVTIFIAFLLFLTFTRQLPKSSIINDDYGKLAVISYIITGTSSIMAGFQNELGGPAMVGILAMLPWMILGWWYPQLVKLNNPSR